ncbi:translation factor SUA5 [Rhodovulum imhoffii]|uniref:Threonylcarbamoyl-AMP synthase n=1 Tax=Rhodovulum imhoffii TaxID=365340 RepID=A0A2T5BUC3_9RHOB|nr:L-threonylcarbamoyladenylate synthase [Rhodovulum imhoffii]MBK5934510.1 threonylcarbamoyl-AMP synthase [Rhodovulum imhoffii]PTN03073.1 translation factor SUA5 [Rhodovulum imhoffii]
MPTLALAPTPDGLNRAAGMLRAGDLVAFPTETVYGLGADARNDIAVARIFQAKGRPRFNPLIVHLPDLAAAREIAAFPDEALRLASAFWPGALTLVLPLKGTALSPLVTAGLDTVALRVPDHPVAHTLLETFGGPVAAPSANPSGKVSPTRAAHVLEGLSGRIEAVVDGGPCPVGVESTIIGFTPTPALLRPGGLPVEAIEACLGGALTRHAKGARPNAPGQLASHYAPAAAVRLGRTTPEPGDLWLGFGPTPGADLNLSESGDLVEAAANLFHHLRSLDARAAPGQGISVAPVPPHGLGHAINDRLRRAAAPR